jgi:protein-tyrosine kinase
MALATTKKQMRDQPATRGAPPIVRPSPIVMLTDPKGAPAEAIRALRTRIQSQHIQKGRRALAICGPNPEVGATFIGVNLAVALAQIGIKTLLIEADLREPTVHSYFPSVEPGGGLRSCLASADADVADFCVQEIVPNLDVLFAGGADDLAHEFLASDRFPEVINSCLRDYAMTIVDTPPANGSADSRRISTVVGFSLIVARKNKTLVSDVHTLADQLAKERAAVIGTVLNGY